jgi:DNA-binding transcriptional ArsR family regulator
VQEELAFELQTRKRIYDTIVSSPGLHLRELSRLLDIPLGTLRYHLSYLEKHELINAQKDHRYKRYYSRKLSPQQKRILAKLRREIPRGIVLFLLLNPNSKHSDLLENFDLSPSTITYYLKRLTAEGIIKRSDEHEYTYSVVNQEQIINIFLTYRITFKDYLLDKLLDKLHPSQSDRTHQISESSAQTNFLTLNNTDEQSKPTSKHVSKPTGM